MFNKYPFKVIQYMIIIDIMPDLLRINSIIFKKCCLDLGEVMAYFITL